MTRLLSFTYAGLTIGAGQSGSAYHLTGRYRFRHEYGSASLVFEVAIQHDTRASFLTAEADLLTAYRKPDQALVVELDSTERHAYDPADNSGFLARANVRKLGGQEDTANSSRYECSVVVQLPADLSGRAGRQSATVDVSTTPSGRRSCTITGVYTALSNNAARAQFAAQIAAYATSVLSGLGGTWELVGTPQASTDDQDKILTFSRRYEEVIYAQSAAGTDAAALVGPRLRIRRSKSAANSTQALGGAADWIRLDVSYSTAVDKAETTDLLALWRDTIRPWILEEARRVSEVSVVIVNRETVDPDQDENRIDATMELLADPGAPFVRADVEVRDEIDHGVILKPVWNGKPYARDRYQGLGSWVRSVKKVTIYRGEAENPQGDPQQFAGFELVREASTRKRFFAAIPGDETPLQFDLSSTVYVRADVENADAPSDDGTRERPRPQQESTQERGA